MCYETQYVMALQGHPRSLILAPIENVHAISYWSSIVTLVLSCPVSEILQVSGEQRPHLYSTRILGMHQQVVKRGLAEMWQGKRIGEMSSAQYLESTEKMRIFRRRYIVGI